MKRIRRKHIVLIAALVVIIVVITVKPSDIGGPYDPYFSGLNSALKEAGVGRPCIVLDLDRVDHNIALVTQHLTPHFQYRIVAKSLPSEELLKYVMEKAGTRKIMGFHQPFLPILVRELGEVDILLGKPLLVEAAEDFYEGIPQEQHDEVSSKIQWLVDTEHRLKNYLALAEAQNLVLRINIEIDIGLHRGGVPDTGELGKLLEIIAANPERLEFTGFMGYEAHVVHAPPVISSVARAFKQAMDKYKEFYDYGRETYPALFEGDLTFNSGGSKTYRLFTKGLPVNDIAAGSCMVKPSTFAGLEDHQAALFIAAPVIKKLEGPQVAFLDAVRGLIVRWNPNMAQSYYLYGGGWAAEIVSPPGVRANALTAYKPNENLLPNQSLYNGSKKVPVEEGDFVFFHPDQGDAMSQFEEIIVVRGNKIVNRWASFSKKY